MKVLGVGLVVFVLTIFALVLNVTLNGFALSLWWSWFFIPAFGVPAISKVTAIALASFLRYATYQDDSEYATKDFINKVVGKETRSPAEKVGTLLGKAFIVPVLWICLGWILSQFL